MVKKLSFTALVVILTSFHLQAQEITSNRFGKGIIDIVAKDSSYSANFAVRMQSLFTSEMEILEDGELGEAETAFLIRRARLKFGGFAYSPKLIYKIELGLSNNDISGVSPFTGDAPLYILDAMVAWNFYGNFELIAGQTKLPGNRERVISSANMETVDRSLVNSRFNIDRDLGVQLHHFFVLGEDVLFREAIAISQGEGRNIVSGNIGGYQYTARAEVLPFGDFADYTGADLVREPDPKLSVGVSYDYNDNAVKTRSNLGSYMFNDTGFFETDITTVFVDAMFKYQGISMMAEYAHRNADTPIAINSDGTLTGDEVNVGDGFNIQAGYVFKNNYQILGRYTTIDLDDQITQLVEDQYTIGLSKYIVGHKLKIQTDISYTDLNLGFNDSLLYRLQFDIHL